ncbi:MAG: type II toxin-antitoxin system PemK/MazF family toxin [Magnetococcales bacterium]|nr:type II toxin-antitoxin system PemK/MazF family toxin [Magnetococcales bacterium]
MLVPFPFADMEVVKSRPVLVLTAPDERGDFVGLAVTFVPTVCRALELTAPAILEGALPKASWLRLDKIFTLNRRRVEGHFARVTPAFRRHVVQEMCVLLTTNDPPLAHP